MSFLFFLKKIIKFNILLLLLSSHLFLVGYLTQYFHQPERIVHQPATPIKINLITVLQQKPVKQKKTPEKTTVQKKQSTQKVDTRKIAKSPSKTIAVVERKPSQSVKKKMGSKKTVIHTSTPVTVQKSTQSLRKIQPLVSKSVSTPIPSNAREQQIPVSAPARKTEPLPPRESGETKNPSYQGNPLKPPYPSLSRKRGEEGTVHLRVTVNPDGKPSAVTVSKSSGYSRLDNAAVSHVQKWRFNPAKKNGKAVSGTVIVPISFRLS